MKLYRKQQERMLGGVAGGLADYLNVDVVFVRLIFVLLALINGLGLVAYMVMWLLIPDEGSLDATSEETMRTNIEDMSDQARRIGENMNTQRGSTLFGIVLVGLGLLFLLQRVLPALNLALLWPVLLIVVGVYLLLTNR